MAAPLPPKLISLCPQTSGLTFSSTGLSFCCTVAVKPTSSWSETGLRFFSWHNTSGLAFCPTIADDASSCWTLTPGLVWSTSEEHAPEVDCRPIENAETKQHFQNVNYKRPYCLNISGFIKNVLGPILTVFMYRCLFSFSYAQETHNTSILKMTYYLQMLL